VQRTTYKGEPTILFAGEENDAAQRESHKGCGTRWGAKDFRIAMRRRSIQAIQVTERVPQKTKSRVLGPNQGTRLLN